MYSEILFVIFLMFTSLIVVSFLHIMEMGPVFDSTLRCVDITVFNRSIEQQYMVVEL